VRGRLRGVPEQTNGVDFVALRRRGLLAIGPDGIVWMIMPDAGFWTLYAVSVAEGTTPVHSAFTRRGCVARVVLAYSPLGF